MPESSRLIGRWMSWRIGSVRRRDVMVGPLKPKSKASGPSRRSAVGLIVGAPLLGACAGVQQTLSGFSGSSGSPQEPLAVGNGQVKIGLILPLSASGNAAVAAQSMKNAAEMALAGSQNPNTQRLNKDDAGSPRGVQQGTEQALEQRPETILGLPCARS